MQACNPCQCTIELKKVSSIDLKQWKNHCYGLQYPFQASVQLLAELNAYGILEVSDCCCDFLVCEVLKTVYLIDLILILFSQTPMQVEREANVFETQQQEMKQTRQLLRYALLDNVSGI